MPPDAPPDVPTTDALLLPRRPWRPLVTASAGVGAALLALAMLGGALPVLLVIAVAMLLMAGGWVLLLGLPSPRGTTAVLAGASVILLCGGVLSQEAQASVLPGAVGLAMIVEFGHQLARRDGRPRLVESVSGSVTGIALLTSGASVLLLTSTQAGVAASVTVFGAVAVASLADLGLRWGAGGPVAGVVAVLLGAAAGIAIGVFGPSADAGIAPWLLGIAGGAAAGASYALRQVQSVLPTLFGRRAQVASGVSSVLAPGVLAYALAWVALGPDMMALMH